MIKENSAPVVIPAERTTDFLEISSPIVEASEFSPQSLLPHPYRSFDEVNASKSFSIEIGSTVYTVNTHFDPNGKRSVFGQLKDILLKD